MNYLIAPQLNINFEQLAKQKLLLVKMTFSPKEYGLKTEQVDELEGLINLIDKIQDHAVDSDSIDFRTVFPNLDKIDQ